MTNDVTVDELSVRDKVHLIEDEMHKLPQVECPVRHYFSQGVYAREITIPAGTLLTGKIHKFCQLNILSSGDMTVVTDEGPIRVQAPFTIVSPPGTKRIAYAHTECVWTTIHGTDLTDLVEIEAHFIAQDETEYRAFLEAEAAKTKEIEQCRG